MFITMVFLSGWNQNYFQHKHVDSLHASLSEGLNCDLVEEIMRLWSVRPNKNKSSFSSRPHAFFLTYRFFLTFLPKISFRPPKLFPQVISPPSPSKSFLHLPPASHFSTFPQQVISPPSPSKSFLHLPPASHFSTFRPQRKYILEHQWCRSSYL